MLQSVVVLQQIEQLSADSVCVTARAEEQQPSDIPSVKKPIEYNVGCDMSQPISDEVENPVETGSFCAAEGQVMVKLQETNKGSQSKESGQAQKEAKGNWRKRKFHDVSTYSDFTTADDKDSCKKVFCAMHSCLCHCRPLIENTKLLKLWNTFKKESVH